MLDLLSKGNEVTIRPSNRVMVDAYPTVNSEQKEEKSIYDKSFKEALDDDEINLSDYFTYWLDRLYKWSDNNG